MHLIRMGCDYDANVRGIMHFRLHNIVRYGTYIDEETRLIASLQLWTLRQYKLRTLRQYHFGHCFNTISVMASLPLRSWPLYQYFYRLHPLLFPIQTFAHHQLLSTMPDEKFAVILPDFDNGFETVGHKGRGYDQYP